MDIPHRDNNPDRSSSCCALERSRYQLSNSQLIDLFCLKNIFKVPPAESSQLQKPRSTRIWLQPPSGARNTASRLHVHCSGQRKTQLRVGSDISERTAENRALALIGTAAAPSDLFNSSKRKKWDGTEAVPPGPNPLADHNNSAKTLLRRRNCHKSNFGLSNQDNHEYTRKLSSERSAAR